MKYHKHEEETQKKKLLLTYCFQKSFLIRLGLDGNYLEANYGSDLFNELKSA